MRNLSDGQCYFNDGKMQASGLLYQLLVHLENATQMPTVSTTRQIHQHIYQKAKSSLIKSNFSLKNLVFGLYKPDAFPSAQFVQVSICYCYPFSLAITETCLHFNIAKSYFSLVALNFDLPDFKYTLFRHLLAVRHFVST